MKDRSIYGFNSPVQILSNGRIIAEGGYWDGRLTV